MSDEFKSDIATGPMRIPFKTFPADRISDDKTVQDAIYNAVLTERERCARIASSCRTKDQTEFGRGADGVARTIEKGIHGGWAKLKIGKCQSCGGSTLLPDIRFSPRT